ncbi:MFS transporter [Brevibacillus ruminantium]|uniref:MFS transporter n=1 Tax=Brevibacillus ruminantium TaxID=2950604 RepID=A0ABY4WGJ9_9BACL|nr:MFS transporter [Brevibacillus ruminantium]USG66283.1 MFS transporter [Brevibacillus ruminantium]
MKKTGQTGFPASFWLILSGQAVSEMGASLGTLANSWVLLQATGSPTAVGSMWLLYFLPSLMVQLFIGPYLDRWDPKRVMIASQLARGAAFACSFAATSAGFAGLWPVYLTSLVNGLVQPLYVPASLSLLPSVVRPDTLTRANAALDGSLRLAMIAGPTLGGLLIGLLDGPGALALTAGAFAISGVLLSFCQSSTPLERAKQEAWVSMFAAGLRVFREEPLLLRLGVLLSFVQFAVGVSMVLTLPYVTAELQGTSAHAGLLLAGFPLGYVCGSMLVVPLSRKWSRSALMMFSLLAGGASFVLLALVHSIWLAILIEILAGITAPFFHVHSTSLYQTRVPSHLLGRVLSVRLLIIRVTMPLGVWLGGLLGESVGIRPVYAGMGLLVVIAAALLPLRARYLEAEKRESAVKYS